IRLGSLALLSLVAACTGEIESDNLEGLPPEEQVARTAWVDKALPIFAENCNSCHGGSMPMIAYVAGTDDLMKRDTLVNYVPRIVNLGAPQSSRVLTKGDHSATGGGPALLAPQATDILMWILAESRAHPVTALRTAPATAMTGGMMNTVDLSSLGVPATLTFSLDAVGADAYFTNLKLTAGASGLYFEHPLLETNPAGSTEPKPDPIDRFFAVQGNLMPNQSITIGDGTASVAGFNPTDPLSFRFDVFEAKH
ncbi:MAG TPA: hypothetical protein VMZ53_12230, partial [Kofleriaceae bacterium]|nr:hypothetical protein [Kofleriaceae bacterium]